VSGLRHRVAAPLAGAVLVLAAWEVGVRLAGVPPYTLPPPSAVARAFGQVAHLLPRHVAATVRTAVAGLVTGVVAAVAIAALLDAVPVLRRVLQPWLVASQSIPSVVTAPVLVALFGFGWVPRVIVVALVVFFPVAVATLDGLRDADPELVELVTTMGASRRQVLWWVRVPAALGPFASGVRIASAYAMFGAIVAEWMGAEEGIGVYFNRVRATYRMDRVLVAIVVIAVLSIALYSVVSLLARRATPWLQAGSAGEQR